MFPNSPHDWRSFFISRDVLDRLLSLQILLIADMDDGGQQVPRFRRQINLVRDEDALRRVGSVSDWCLRQGHTLGHPPNLSAKVARIITLGCVSNRPLRAELVEAVPEATTGSWWITEAAVDGHDLEMYHRLVCRAENFRDDAWRPQRQERWAKYTLDVIAAEMQLFRIMIAFLDPDNEDASEDDALWDMLRRLQG